MKLKNLLFNPKNLWHLGAFVLFLILSVGYFYPTLKGFTIKQGDITNWIGASQEIKDYSENNEDEALWTNAMFSGMPSTQIHVKYPGIQIVDFVRNALTLWLPSPINFILLYFIGFYILSISLKVKPYIGIIGSIMYGLSSYFIIILEAGHNTKALAIGYAPLVLAGFIWAYRSKKWMFAIALSALFMTFELRVNHFQITYYLAILMVALGIVELIKAIKDKKIPDFFKRTIGLFLAYAIALFINFGNISGTLEYTKHTTRGGSNLSIKSNGDVKDQKEKGLETTYITNWSYGVGESFTLIVPNFKGGGTQAIGQNKDNKERLKKIAPQFRQNVAGSNQYFGEQPFTSGPVYVGIIVVFLAFLALFYLDDKIKWALLAVAILTLMLSWGKNFLGLTDLFVQYFPGYNKFRAVTIILFVVELILPILAILFLQKLVEKKDEIVANIKPFFIISGGFLLLLLGFLITPSLFNTFLTSQELAMLNSIEDPQMFDVYEEFFEEIANVRISVFRSDVLRTLAFFVLGAGLIFAYLKTEFHKYAMSGILFLLIFVDLFAVDSRYLNTSTKGNEASWIEKWKQDYPFVAGNGDKQILTYEASLNEKVQNEINTQISESQKRVKNDKLKGGVVQRIYEWGDFRALNRVSNFRVFEQGNPFNSSRTSYFHKSIGGYHGAKLIRYQDLIEFHLGKSNQTILNMLNTKYVMSYGGDNVQANPNNLGNAWFVQSVQSVNNDDEEMIGICNDYKLVSSGELEILVNNKPVQKADLKGIEDLAMVLPKPDGNDTVEIPLPINVEKNQNLSYIFTPEGEPKWGLTNMLDSNMASIVQFEKVNEFAPDKKAVMQAEFRDKLGSDTYSGKGEIKLTSYDPMHLTYETNSSDKQLAVFSEIYYPVGWKALIDGKETDILRANYVLRALEIPAGNHKVEFVYELNSFKKAKPIAYIFTGILFVLLVGTFYLSFIKQASEEEIS